MNEGALKQWFLKYNIEFKDFELFMLNKTVSSSTSGENFYFDEDIKSFLNQI